MSLLEGIKIYTEIEISDRIFLSNGTYETKVLNGIDCRENTYIPLKPWMIPSQSELDLLLHINNNIIPYQSIGILKLPNYIATDPGLLKIHNSTTPEMLYENMQLADCKKILLDIEKFAELYKNPNAIQSIYGIGCYSKNLETITFDRKEKKYIGLHLDSWDRKPISLKDEASNRICFNLGKDIRSFLFINQEIKNLIKFLPENKYEDDNHYALIYDFLKGNANYPVVKIQLRPFEGYIAPTENIIHDGSSLGQRFMDINLLFKSYYDVYKISHKFG